MIEYLWQHWPLDKALRAALERFATYPAMRTVWGKLPAEPESAAGHVVYCAIIAIGVFTKLPRPFPTAGRRAAIDRWVQWVREHPPPTSNELTVWHAVELGKEVLNTSDDLWAQYFQGLDRAHVISILAATAQSFASMEEERQAWLTAMQFPDVPQRDRQDADELFFCRWMSSRLRAIYRCDCDTAVSGLTLVAFDREDVAVETVRWRRRTDRKERSD